MYAWGSKPLQGLVLRLWVPGSQLPRSTSSTLTWSLHPLLSSAHSSPTPSHSFPLPALGWARLLEACPGA